MPDDEQKVKLIDKQKRAMIENAIVEHPVYKNMLEALSEFSGVKINIDEMVDAYMDIATPTKNEDGVAFAVNLNLIGEVIDGTKYSISQEENGIVLEPNGEIDVDASVTQRMMAQYNFVEGFENLSKEEQIALYDKISSIADGKDISYNECLEIASSMKIDYNELFGGRVLETDFAYVDPLEAVVAKDYMDEIDNVFLETAEDIDLTDAVFQYSLNSQNPNAINELLDKIQNNPKAQKYFQNGRYDIDSLLKDNQKWQEAFAHRVNKKKILEYLTDVTDGKPFGSQPAETRAEILKAYFEEITNPNNDEKEQLIYAESLKVIAPNLIKRLPKDMSMQEYIKLSSKDGKPFNFESLINEEAFVNLYNSTLIVEEGKTTTRFKSMAEIKKVFETSERNHIIEHLGHLKIDARNGTLRSKEELKQLKSVDYIEKLTSRIEKEKRKPHVEYTKADVRLSERMKKQINRLGLNRTEAVPSVIGTYLRLQNRLDEMSKSPDYDNTKRPQELIALELMESYMISQPSLYGSYIKNTLDRNGNETKALDIKKMRADIKKDRVSIANKSRINSLTEIVDDTAEEQKIYETNKYSIEGLKAYRKIAKEGIKRFIKRGLIYAVGEEKTQAFAKNLRGNFLYKGAKNVTYGIVGAIDDVADRAKAKIDSDRKKEERKAKPMLNPSRSTVSDSLKHIDGIEQKEATALREYEESEKALKEQGNKDSLENTFDEK